MDAEVERLLKDAVTDLVRLEVALFYHQNPAFVDSAEAISRRLYRDLPVVEQAVAGLVKCGLLDRFELGSGRYVLYSYTRNPQIRGSVAALSAVYHENDQGRVEIIRFLMKSGLMGARAPAGGS